MNAKKRDMVCRTGNREKGGKMRAPIHPAKAKTLLAVTLALALASCVLPGVSCGGKKEAEDSAVKIRLDDDSAGCLEVVSNIVNTTVVSNDPNVYKAEYEAGFMQGKMQKDSIIAYRDNSWDSAYLTDPSHTFPKQIPPSSDELTMASRTLAMNWRYTLDYITRLGTSETGRRMRRLMYRLIGISDGVSKEEPGGPAFDDTWLPDYAGAEMTLGYETPGLTFLDIYYVNAYIDMSYISPDQMQKLEARVSSDSACLISAAVEPPGKCSAFVKRTDGDIYLTHNSWMCFLDQSQALNLWVNGDLMSSCTAGPGCLCSLEDFGYNNKGIMFNETTLRYSHNEPKVEALWMFWRSALAEQFASSLDEFFEYMSLEASGTYMNGYMVVDANREEIGLVEMSYKSFVFFRPDGKGGVSVSTKPEGLSAEYDRELVTPDYILGINYPASLLIREELQSQDNRPARRRQFLAQIGGVTDIESAKALITYIDPQNPLSIYGRWDLGYGDTPFPKTIPDGSVDAKAASASMVREACSLEGVLDLESPVKSYWMKFGTPYVNGKPFIWSESQWKDQKLRDVPDVVDGQWELLDANIR